MRTFKNLLQIFIFTLLFISCDDRVTYTWNKDSLDEIINQKDDKMIIIYLFWGFWGAPDFFGGCKVTIGKF